MDIKEVNKSLCWYWLCYQQSSKKMSLRIIFLPCETRRKRQIRTFVCGSLIPWSCCGSHRWASWDFFEFLFCDEWVIWTFVCGCWFPGAVAYVIVRLRFFGVPFRDKGLVILIICSKVLAYSASKIMNVIFYSYFVVDWGLNE